MPKRIWRKWEGLNQRFGAQFMAFCLLVSTLTIIGIFVEQRTNNAQSAQQRSDQAAATKHLTNLVICFDKSFNQLTTGQPKVREASKLRNQALYNAFIGGRDDQGVQHVGLGEVLKRSLADAVAHRQDTQNPLVTLRKLNREFDAFSKADRHLLKVQAKNPYPASPAKTCDLNKTLPQGTRALLPQPK